MFGSIRLRLSATFSSLGARYAKWASKLDLPSSTMPRYPPTGMCTCPTADGRLVRGSPQNPVEPSRHCFWADNSNPSLATIAVNAVSPASITRMLRVQSFPQATMSVSSAQKVMCTPTCSAVFSAALNPMFQRSELLQSLFMQSLHSPRTLLSFHPGSWRWSFGYTRKEILRACSRHEGSTDTAPMGAGSRYARSTRPRKTRTTNCPPRASS